MKITITFISILFAIAVEGQHLEAGLFGGGSAYLGDLSENSSRVILKETQLSGGIFISYNISESFAVRLGGLYGKLSGSDANARKEAIKSRNLSFRSSLWDIHLLAEYNILGYQPYNFEKTLSPYLFAGIGLTLFDPETNYEEEWVKLQTLGTEGQGASGHSAPYDLNAFNIPFGIGVKYALTEKLNLRLEIGARKTLTDYLDDVGGTYVNFDELLAINGSLAAALGNREGEYLGTDPVSVPTGTPRGDETGSDWYFIAGLGISYNFLDNGLVGGRRKLRNKKGCKTQ